MADRPPTPNVNLLSARHAEYLALLGFFEWCEEQRIEYEFQPDRGSWSPDNYKPQRLIMRYLEIDEARLEHERRSILDAARPMTTKGASRG